MPRRAAGVTAALVLLALASAARPSPAAGAEPAAAKAPSGVAAFSRHDRYAEAKLSPRGTYLALVSVESGKRQLQIVDLAKRTIVAAAMPSSDTMPYRFYWANDERLVAELVDQGDGALDAPVSRGEIASVDARTGNGKLVFGYRAGEMQAGSHIRRAESERAWGRIVDTLRNDDRRVLVETTSWRESGDRVVSLWKLDVYTGVKTQVGVSPLREAVFLTDENGEPRLAIGHDEALKRRAFYREPAGPWTELAGLAGLSPGALPVGFVARDRTIYVADGDAKGFGVWSVGIDDGARKLLAHDALAQPGRYLRDRATGRIVAVEFEPDLPRWEIADRAHPLAKVLEGLLASFPGEHVRIESATLDQKKVVAFVYGDRSPGRFLLVDAATLKAEPVADVRPWIDPEAMAETSAFHIPASDGTRIHGYFTLPPKPGPGAPPLVVLPHGGPHGPRDHWGFDPEVQLLASEGFAVLQVNYRGSGGYGLAYEEAGHRHWGDRVVQDIVDATRFAVRKGLADPKRICAFGGSFGAYAAVQLTVVAPDLFRCAVGYAGIYDLTRMKDSDFAESSRLGRGYVRTAVGEDEVALRAVSPVYEASRMKARVLLVHGEEDRRAPIEHAKALRAALQDAGNPPEWLVEPKEGHGFYDEAARERLYRRVLAFLREGTAPPKP